jgi:hypothetical protein
MTDALKPSELFGLRWRSLITRTRGPLPETVSGERSGPSEN